MSQPGAFGCAFNQAGDVGHYKALAFVHAHHAQVGVQRGEGIVGHFGAGGGHGADQGGFAGIGHAQQADVGQYFQFQQQSARFAGFAGRGLFGRAVDRRFEMDVAQATFAAARQANALAVPREVGHDFAGIGIAD